MKTKILHVLGGLSAGGVETLLINIIKNIDRERFQIDIVVHHPNQNTYYDLVKELGCRIFECPAYNFTNHKKYKKWWNNFFKSNPDYKIVHAHNTSIAAVYLKIAKQYGLKTISHIHSVSFGVGLKGFVKKLTSRKVKKYADIKLGCSTEANEFLYGKKLVKNNQCIVLKNGLDFGPLFFDKNKRDLIRENCRLNKDEFVIGTVGRMIPLKNPFFIIDLMRELSKQRKNVKILWVGSGPLKDQIVAKIKQSKLENYFVLVDEVTNVGDYLSSMDAFVFPSKKEGLGIALIEAQANGLKCLVSDSISDEAIITPLVTKLTTANVLAWSQILTTFSINYSRIENQENIKKSDYNISTVIKNLTKIYEE